MISIHFTAILTTHASIIATGKKALFDAYSPSNTYIFAFFIWYPIKVFAFMAQDYEDDTNNFCGRNHCIFANTIIYSSSISISRYGAKKILIRLR
jgi:hypothetical protein